jgi:hypothetical protein
MKPEELRDLAKIAALIADRDLAALASLRARRADLARAAEILARPQAPSSGNALGPSELAGAGARWDRWRKQELVRIQMERARLGAEEAAAKDIAARSFGRQSVLSELAETAAAERAGRRQGALPET